MFINGCCGTLSVKGRDASIQRESRLRKARIREIHPISLQKVQLHLFLQHKKAERSVNCALTYAGDQKHHESERPGRVGDYRLISVAGQSEPAGSNHPAPGGVKFSAA